jgi:GTP-binding protein LepA
MKILKSDKYSINFCLIAHIDHGKSTVAAAILTIVFQRAFNLFIMDDHEIEQERGITIRSTYMSFMYLGCKFNMIDTPGHMDFANQIDIFMPYIDYAIVLVDVLKGIQAQTINNEAIAKACGTNIIYVINKIDVADADIIRDLERDMRSFFQIPVGQQVFHISGKSSYGIEALISHLHFLHIHKQHYLSRIPQDSKILDAFKDKAGNWWFLVKVGFDFVPNKPCYIDAGKSFRITDLYVKDPILRLIEEYCMNDFVLVKTDIRRDLSINYIELKHSPVQENPGFAMANQLFWVSIYPDNTDIATLKIALYKILVNDRGFSFVDVSHAYLGTGLMASFTGLLHMEIVIERLLKEYKIKCIQLRASMAYRYRDKEGIYKFIQASESASSDILSKLEEPFGHIIFTTNIAYADNICDTLKRKRGILIKLDSVSSNIVYGEYHVPAYHCMTGLIDTLYSATHGHITISSRGIIYLPQKVVKASVLCHETTVDFLTTFMHTDDVDQYLNDAVNKLSEVVPREQFDFNIRGFADNKCLRSKRIKQYRKNVLMQAKKVTGLDRQRKLLQNQAKNKSIMKTKGNVSIDRLSLTRAYALKKR